MSTVEQLSLEQIRGAIASGEHPPHVIHQLERLAASRSPESTSASSNYASPPGGSSDTSTGSRFDFNLDFWKLGQQRNKDGEKPKRRGPKPDSKPALTRRQELNRQAQRTHRERKERYVKGLEEEVNRLRETFTIITREKTQILEENRRLKELLELHGISYNQSEVANTNSQVERQRRIDQAPEIARFNRSYDEIGIDFVLAPQ